MRKRPPAVLVDTNVFVAALLGRAGHNREVLRACLENRIRPLMGQALFLEYEALLARPELFKASPLRERERQALFDAYLSMCEWVEVFFPLRPNLPDEEDNHILELAFAGGASMIVTNNTRHFQHSQLRFPDIRVLNPASFLETMK